MSEPMMAADGRPLKASLNRALRRQKIRALALIAPLLIFIVVSFVMPIADMLFRSVENMPPIQADLTCETGGPPGRAADICHHFDRAILLALQVDNFSQHLIGGCDGFRVRREAALRGDHLDKLQGQVNIRQLQRVGKNVADP